MNDKIHEIVRRTYRYFYVDGLVEMALGILFLFIGVMLLVWLRLDVRSGPGILAILTLIVFAIAGSAIVKRIVRLAKEQITYQRTGYVSYWTGEPPASRWPLVVAGFALILLLFVLPETFNKMSFVGGSLLGFLFVHTGYRMRLARFYVVGSLTFFAGLAITQTVADELTGATLTVAATGLVLLISGIIVFLVYLQRHPIEEEE